MFQYDGRCPARRSHLALEKYRKDRPHLYNEGGLLPTNGEEWWRIRQALQRPLNISKSFENFHPSFGEIATEFVDSINRTSDDFVEDLKRYFLEITGFFTLDTRLGAMKRRQHGSRFHSVKTNKIAVLKETLRLNPVSVGIGRICQTSDAVFSGYSVPKGTVLRWMDKNQNYHPYLVLPFGFGPRMCIGRRIAEMSILHLLIELLKKYEIKLKDPKLELGCISYLINSPDKPLQLELKRV
ncbi:DIB [Lepeophtheirus salmonis]|uniref:Cholesterol side-chain cleavage enzyme, mitochondrial n=1 Tax=Lepeophtheirus salmonis TaxID=72036 RepID=A0A7R8H0P8_LEPSM|nr:DIB [Lepeophtheirus salmonis]CAF2795286.1 DIB [Lepeophtheirus salmonis]